MKQFLHKAIEVLRSVWNASLALASWLVAFLLSVNIDQPRGVILCLTFQLVVVIAMVLTFRSTTGPPAKPLEGQVQPPNTPPVAESVEPDLPILPLPQPDNL